VFFVVKRIPPGLSSLRGTASTLAHFSRNSQIFAASGKRFLSATKPLILLAKTTVKPNNVKYVFLTRRCKTWLYCGKPTQEKEGIAAKNGNETTPAPEKTGRIWQEGLQIRVIGRLS
jgi:hypothetical protein